MHVSEHRDELISHKVAIQNNLISSGDYACCLAAALAYLMIHQQDPVGLMTFDEKIRGSLPARSKRTQLGNILGLLAKSKPAGQTEIAMNLRKIAAMIKHRSLLMLFSDLLTDPDAVIESLHLLRHRGHDVILFHILDEAEVTFPFDGLVDLKDPETGQSLVIDADGIRADYLESLEALRSRYRRDCLSTGVDYVALDTSTPFDRALIEYLSQRKARF
ncbi:hypothetical protein IID19_03610 [Patescibacteria group bacterium]|nr:hypothetical protein [Patescibacteria group bacterium]